jgi:RecQ-mediated genome instability protein 1
VQQLIKRTEEQLLFSDLSVSLSQGALPTGLGTEPDVRVPGRVLVQVLSINDISHPALVLKDVHEQRKEHAATSLSGLAPSPRPPFGGNEAAAKTVEPPKFPRGMLSLELSDGFTTISAIEYKTVPGLSMDTTELGAKVRRFPQVRAPLCTHLTIERAAFTKGRALLARDHPARAVGSDGQRLPS